MNSLNFLAPMIQCFVEIFKKKKYMILKKQAAKNDLNFVC